MLKNKTMRGKTGMMTNAKSERSNAAASGKKTVRRGTKKKMLEKELDAAGFDARSMAQQLHAFHHAADAHTPEPKVPRLLPELDGVTPLTAHEIHSDLRAIQSAFTAFQAKIHARLPAAKARRYTGSDVYANGRENAARAVDEAYATSSAFMYQRRRARANGVITPEEVVETLPVARRAVRITQRELAAMKRERDDLERDFMRLRCKLIWQLGEMKRNQQRQQRALKALGKEVVTKAKTLESSRRRTNALQDVMNELDARATEIMRLTRYKTQLEELLRLHEVALPEIDEMYLGDRVSCPFGQGVVTEMDPTARVTVIALAAGGTAYVQEDDVEVRALEVTYAETEDELKQRLFDKVGALVNPDGNITMTLTNRRRQRLGKDIAGSDEDEGDDAMDDDDSEDESDSNSDESSGDEEAGDCEDSTREAITPSSVLHAMEGDSSQPKKKRKTMMLPSTSSSTGKHKRQKTGKLLDFTACKLRITPYDTGLMLSPLSVLPERVAAFGPTSLQWLSSYLPSKLAEFEEERYKSLQMQGDIERLRFQLSKAEEERTEAQQLAADQLESINHLVTQMDKLRETLATKEAKEKELATELKALKAHPKAVTECPHCSANPHDNAPAPTKKSPTSASAKPTKANGKAAGRSTRRQHPESSEESADHKEENAPPDKDKETEDEDSSDHSIKPAPRSLRPRRGSRGDKATK